ncbi:glycerol-3-phosphate dehydrogenase/oxidase [Paracoccus sp. SCSIO 75233]|uniref:glycerol-3-phosphate dehydrogenase/oxidase n=1 Tax=Paracoccus sp. SCSIO 75233 TaxID=3017782 RepID=UPI0022F100C6|nr:glycerol-3-phosphate dehydrogenase/oxidase [Paracoccus sp. SCSIO 75233]WBU53884.1 glycerol-3-phosphate dehydrogenase/oxidase [Paracoccus sp. SCSIO 75233]
MSEIAETDVLILGGGINGCGTFRDLSAQGVDCLLLERTDFCAGASAASSRLMHGGLKYLETGEFRLVRESAEERNRLLKNAAHYVSPLPSILPLRSRLGGIVPSMLRFFRLKAKMNDRGTVITRLGLTLYDIYGRNFRAMPTHSMLSRAKLDRTVAGLDAGIIGAGLYYEGQISHAERLGLELILDGEALNPGSKGLNHVTIEGQEGGVIAYRHNGETHHVRPKVVVNAGGAWIDSVNAAIGLETKLMGGSKGAHLVVENDRLYQVLNGHMVYFGTADGRVNLVYPFMNRVLIGSTDIKIDDPDEAVCSDEEATYLRNVVAEIFPDIPVTEDQVRHRFSGVRPLPDAEGDIGMVTRDHSIAELALPEGTPVLCLIGGKWTTFRGFSAETTDKILPMVGGQRKTGTENMQIGGGKGYPDADARAGWIADHARRTNLSEARMGELLDRYGTRAALMADALAGEAPLETLPDYSVEELRWLVENERVGSLDDLLSRRTAIAISGRLTGEVQREIEARVLAV